MTDGSFRNNLRQKLVTAMLWSKKAETIGLRDHHLDMIWDYADKLALSGNGDDPEQCSRGNYIEEAMTETNAIEWVIPL